MTDDTTLAPLAPAETTTTAPSAPTDGDTTTTTGQEDTQAGATDAGADTRPDQEDDQTKEKRETGSQRNKRRMQALAAELVQREAELEDLRRRVPQNREQQQRQRGDEGESRRGPPKEADFNGDFFAFQNATVAWNAAEASRQAIREELESRDQAYRSQAAASVRREQAIAYQERLDETRERIPDYDTVMSKQSGTYVSDHLADEVMRSEKGPLIAYRLATQPELLRELNGLSGRELSRAVGRLEGTLRMPTSKATTQAKPPLSQLGNGGMSPAFDPAKADMDSYAADYRKRMAAKEKARA